MKPDHLPKDIEIDPVRAEEIRREFEEKMAKIKADHTAAIDKAHEDFQKAAAEAQAQLERALGNSKK